jgi:hypothetical protein
MLLRLLLPLLLYASLRSSDIAFSMNACITGNPNTSLFSLKTTKTLKGSNLTIEIKTVTATTDTFQYGIQGTESTIYLALPQEEELYNDTVLERLFYNVDTGAIYKKTVTLRGSTKEKKRKELLFLAKKIKKALYQSKKKFIS